MTVIGIDTNVLLRLLVNDDPRQREIALAFGRSLDDDRQGYVSFLVLLEISWALRMSYGFSKKETIGAIRHIIGVEQFKIEFADAAVAALEYAENNNADIADALIAAHYRSLGCDFTITFDKKAARRIPGMELLA